MTVAQQIFGEYYEIFLPASLLVFLFFKKEYKLYIRIGASIGSVLCIVASVLKLVSVQNEWVEALSAIGTFTVAGFALVIFIQWIRRTYREVKEDAFDDSPFGKAERRNRKNNRKSRRDHRRKARRRKD